MIVFTVLYVVVAVFCGVLALVIRKQLATRADLSHAARLLLIGVMVVVLILAIFAIDRSLLTLLPAAGVR